mmetsp:Transcript_57004/g.101791  ORF Transcript_57004/g.101791 Transcript_57004/m.101791 type:complete len:322 (-) Transcript_57004:425-1390(-)
MGHPHRCDVGPALAPVLAAAFGHVPAHMGHARAVRRSVFAAPHAVYQGHLLPRTPSFAVRLGHLGGVHNHVHLHVRLVPVHADPLELRPFDAGCVEGHRREGGLGWVQWVRAGNRVKKIDLARHVLSGLCRAVHDLLALRGHGREFLLHLVLEHLDLHVAARTHQAGLVLGCLGLFYHGVAFFHQVFRLRCRQALGLLLGLLQGFLALLHHVIRLVLHLLIFGLCTLLHFLGFAEEALAVKDRLDDGIFRLLHGLVNQLIYKLAYLWAIEQLFCLGNKNSSSLLYCLFDVCVLDTASCILYSFVSKVIDGLLCRFTIYLLL